MAGYVLGADIGSGSVKLTLLMDNGTIAASAGCEYPTVYPAVGWAEQDPESWCTAFGKALQTLLQRAGAAAGQIEAVSLDAATHTAVLLDSQCKPLAPAILWTDQRSRQEVALLDAQHRELILQQALHAPTTVWTLPQLLWVRAHAPQLWAKVAHLVFAKDYLRYRLTGALGTDRIDAAGSMFFDVPGDRWSQELCGLAGIDPRWLPPLLDPLDIAGGVTLAAAAEFGLRAGTPVLVGTTDTAMEMLAAGNVEPGHATVKLATAGRICVISTQARPSPFLFNYRHVVPGLWYPGTATSSCAASFRWFRDTLGHTDYALLDADAAQIAAGSEGLIFHPHLQGELTPYNDPLLRASYVGISSRHTNAHFARATMEGIAFSLRDCIPVLEAQGLAMSRVRIIGGGANSKLWRQIVADVLGLDLEKAAVDDSSFGAAMLAAVGAGWFDSCKAAAQQCVQVQEVTPYDQARHALYENQFLCYRRIGQLLAEVYHDPAF